MFLKWKHCTCMLGVRPHVMLSICITRHQSNTSHLPPQPSKNDKSSQIQSTGRIPLSNPPFVVETLWLYHLPQRRQFSWNSDAPEWVLVLGVELNIQTSWCLQYCPTKSICDRQESCPTVCCIWMSLVLLVLKVMYKNNYIRGISYINWYIPTQYTLQFLESPRWCVHPKKPFFHTQKTKKQTMKGHWNRDTRWKCWEAL